MIKYSYRYNTVNRKTGVEEDFTGVFQTKEAADNWLNTHGGFFKKRGLVFRLRGKLKRKKQ